jgi:hypothetical protein
MGGTPLELVPRFGLYGERRSGQPQFVGTRGMGRLDGLDPCGTPR